MGHGPLRVLGYLLPTAPIFFVLILLFSCETYKIRVAALNSISEECKGSIIYSTIPAPKIASGILQVSLVQFLDSNTGYRKWAKEICEKVILLAKDDSTTNTSFATTILSETARINSWWGSTFLLPAQEVFDELLKSTTKMNKCDREFIIEYGTTRLEKLNSLPFSG